MSALIVFVQIKRKTGQKWSREIRGLTSPLAGSKANRKDDWEDAHLRVDGPANAFAQPTLSHGSERESKSWPGRFEDVVTFTHPIDFRKPETGIRLQGVTIFF